MICREPGLSGWGMTNILAMLLPLNPCTRHNMMNPFCLVHFFKCNIPGAAPRHSPEYFLATVTLKSHGKKKHALWVCAVVVQCTPNNSLKPAALQLPQTYNSQHAGTLKRRRLEITALRMNMRRRLRFSANRQGQGRLRHNPAPV